MAMEVEVIKTSTLTCPECGFAEELEMPTDACLFFHPCSNCQVTLRPQEGDCCVFCSYGDVECPPIQVNPKDGSIIMAQENQMTVDTETLKITGPQTMHCSGCEQTVKFTLKQLPGVQEVNASHKSQRIDLTFDPQVVNMEQVRQELEWIGYQVDEWTGSDEVEKT